MGVLYEHLKPSLLSRSRSLRLQTLRLLNSSLVDVPTSTADLLKKTLQAEEVSIDVQGVQERVLRIGRLPVVVKDGDELAADICRRWLIGVCSRQLLAALMFKRVSGSATQGQPETVVVSCGRGAVSVG